MAVRISKDVNEATGEVTLKIEGALDCDDADLLKQIYAGVRKESASRIAIDLRGLTFVEPECGSILRWLKGQDGVIFQGCDLFINEVVIGQRAAE